MKLLRGFRQASPLKLGIVLVVLCLVVGAAAFQKNRILTMLSFGETITAKFAQDHHLRPYVTEVKIAGVPVGVVRGVALDDNGGVEVSMKLDSDAVDKLGTAPSAAIRATTVLGGNYYMELAPGGDRGRFSGTIPAERTRVPVELGDVAETLQPDARVGMQRAVDRLDATLREGGRDAARDLLRDAPDALEPAGEVLAALRGATGDDMDLTRTVSGLENTARTLNRQQGQLDAIVGSMRDVTAVLDQRRDDVAATLDGLPVDLATARAGLADLDGTLQRVVTTADAARPAVHELGPLLDDADPVLAEARTFVADLRPVLADTRPLVESLVPTASDATAVLDDLSGPVLDRVNGPILHTVLSPYVGSGPYEGSGAADRLFYQEFAYMAANIGNASKSTDPGGAMLPFNPGFGPGSVYGTDLSFEQLLRRLAAPQEEQR
ncbi:MlaD family protein [Pseudonocardia sp. H11422]|uniref:MlaD family protein n=1 Tax=Pseudonocardia sp. H11422 TaxID=2835866 RepID=UPI001BDDB353|nr:MlaD family protein [Pseudonocardia sp. H11422]